MPLELLKDSAALLVIDLQAGTLRTPFVRSADELLGSAAELLTSFRATGRLAVFAVSTGTPPGDTTYGGGRVWPDGFDTLAPELGRRDDEPVVSRAAWSAFAGTDLDETLRARGIDQVVIAGVATTFGIESTARAAYDLGYDVVVVTDAISDMDEASHDAAVDRRFPVLGRTAKVGEIVQLAG